jgi:hypothetical protein
MATTPMMIPNTFPTFITPFKRDFWKSFELSVIKKA